MSFLFKLPSYKELDEINIVMNSNTDDCIICYDNTINKCGNQLKTVCEKINLLCDCSCNLFIHDACLKDWLKVSHTCPVCRKELTHKPTMCKKYCKCDVCRELRHCLFICSMLLVFYVLIHWKHTE